MLQEKGNIQQALQHYEKAYNLTPNNIDINYSLTILYMQQNQLDKALYYANNLQNLVPNNPQINALLQQINSLKKQQNF